MYSIAKKINLEIKKQLKALAENIILVYYFQMILFAYPIFYIEFFSDVLVLKGFKYRQPPKSKKEVHEIENSFFTCQAARQFAHRRLYTLRSVESTRALHQPVNNKFILHQANNIAKRTGRRARANVHYVLNDFKRTTFLLLHLVKKFQKNNEKTCMEYDPFEEFQLK